MVCNIYNESLVRVGEVSTYISLVWQEQYNDVGECQLVVTASSTMQQLLQIGYFVGKSDRTTLWQIKSVEIEDGELWCNGFTAEYTLLNDRILDGSINTDGTASSVETTLRTLVSGRRPASILGLATARGLTETSATQHQYEDIYSIVQDLCVEADYGFRLNHDKTNHKLLFDIYEGTTRSNVKFSEDYGNLSDLSIQMTEKDYYNVAYVGGEENDDEERVWVTCGSTSTTGTERHEVVVDGSSVTKGDDMTAEEYQAALISYGEEKLAEMTAGLAVSFEIAVTDFGSRYDLGDIVTVLIKNYNMTLNVRIIAMEQTYEDNKIKTSITVGTPIVRGGN